MDLRLGFFKSITATDRTDLQVERGKFGVPTVIQNRVHRLPAGSDLRQIKVVIAGVVLSEVETESALSFVKLSHAETLALLGPPFGSSLAFSVPDDHGTGSGKPESVSVVAYFIIHFVRRPLIDAVAIGTILSGALHGRFQMVGADCAAATPFLIHDR